MPSRLAGKGHTTIAAGLLHALLRPYRWKGNLIADFLQYEEGYRPIAAILVPRRPVTQLVLVALIKHDLHDSLVELDVFLLRADDLQQLFFVVVRLLRQLLYLLRGLLVLAPQLLVYCA